MIHMDFEFNFAPIVFAPLVTTACILLISIIKPSFQEKHTKQSIELNKKVCYIQLTCLKRLLIIRTKQYQILRISFMSSEFCFIKFMLLSNLLSWKPSK